MKFARTGTSNTLNAFVRKLLFVLDTAVFLKQDATITWCIMFGFKTSKMILMDLS